MAARNRRNIRHISGRGNATFRFQPFSRRQKQVLSWWADGSPYADMDGIIADGAVRSGKTLSMALSYVVWAMDFYDGQQFGMAGKTISSFRRNVLSFLPGILASRGYETDYNRTDNVLTVWHMQRCNRFLIFGGKDESSQDVVQGATLAGFFFDEAALMPESFINQAIARCSVDGSRLWFSCNPEGPAHWFKREFVDKVAIKRLLYLHFTMDDNLSLSESIKARYSSMYSGVFYRRFIKGEWAVAEGVIYDMFDPERHVIDILPPPRTDSVIVGAMEDIPHTMPRDRRFGQYVSIDYGTQNPTVFLLWERIGKPGKSKWVCTREYYHSGRASGSQKTDSEYAEDLKAFLTETDDDGRKTEIEPDSVIVDPSAASFIAELRARGYTVKQANNAVVDGIRLTRTLLSLNEIAFGSECNHLIEEMNMYAWDEKAAARGEDAPIKENDHAADALRYMVYTVIRKEHKWRQIADVD